MGRRNYGLSFCDADGFRKIVELIKDHNKNNHYDDDDGRGEDLTLACIVVYGSNLYASINSGGGRSDEWISSYLGKKGWKMMFIPSGMKPEGWFLPNNQNVIEDVASLRERFPGIQDDLVAAILDAKVF